MGNTKKKWEEMKATCFMEYCIGLKSKCQLQALFMWNEVFVHMDPSHKQC